MKTSPAGAPGAAIEILRSQSLTTLVQQELEGRILAGDVRPGDKLNEADLAEALRVSRGPVREAFRALEQAGLVRTEKNRGVFVRRISLAEADEIYEVRAGLEALIGRLAAQHAGRQQVTQLRGLVARMRAASHARSVDEYYPLNVGFHDRLAELAGNATLLTTYRSLINQLHLYRRETLAHGQDAFPASTREHAAIVEAIAQRDGELAGRLLHDHVVGSRRRLQSALDRRRPAHPATLALGGNQS